MENILLRFAEYFEKPTFLFTWLAKTVKEFELFSKLLPQNSRKDENVTKKEKKKKTVKA